MKSSLLIVCTFILILFSLPSLANKIMISEQPTFLGKQEGVYVVPDSFNMSSSNYFVVLDGQKNVCYMKPQANLSALNMRSVTVSIGGYQTPWTCYEYNENYFKVAP